MSDSPMKLAGLVTVDYITKKDAAAMKCKHGYYISINNADGAIIAEFAGTNKALAQQVRMNVIRAIQAATK